MKVIAFYLPQFHTIPENDEWWGNGFTEWTNVKKAKPFFLGHDQPKVPLNNNYYNLLDDDVKIWQANLAKKYGIYGFCYYHYWFNGKLLLEKPMEQMLANKDIDIPFCISWCNEPWTSIWVGDEKKVLISQNYGNKKEWIEHYEYLKIFFKDDRYIFKDGKPLIIIYRPDVIPNVKGIINCWNECAIEDGFNGLTFIGLLKDRNKIDDSYKYFNYIIVSLFNNYSIEYIASRKHSLYREFVSTVNKNYEKIFGHSFSSSKIYNIIKLFTKEKKNIHLSNSYGQYDKVMETILHYDPITPNCIPSYIVNWDNTPRYSNNGYYIDGVNVDIFKEYFEKFVLKTKKEYNSDMMFLSAWNEWAEGSILEPDEKFKYGFLESILEVLTKLNELPTYENNK